MLAKPLPMSWLIHSIEYAEYSDMRDEYGNDVIKDPITINNVRYDDGTNYSSNLQEDSLKYAGIVFVDARNSANLPTRFREKSKVYFDGKEMTINKIVNCYHPQSNVIHHYELEVI